MIHQEETKEISYCPTICIDRLLIYFPDKTYLWPEKARLMTSILYRYLDVVGLYYKPRPGTEQMKFLEKNMFGRDL